MKKIIQTLLLISTIASSMLLAPAAHASAPVPGPYLYWAYENGTTNVGKAALDGTDVTQTYLIGGNANGGYDGGISIQGDYLYWTAENSVLRAKMDETHTVETVVTENRAVFSLTTDSQYIYWSREGDSFEGIIGRSRLDGTDINHSFISGTSLSGLGNDTYGLFVDSQHIYWANCTSDTIGRANFDGSNIIPNFISISPASCATSIWKEGNYLYWTSYTNGYIGRASLDGSTTEEHFISVTSTVNPYSVISDGEYLYWSGATTIGRVKLDRTDQNDSFISIAAGFPIGLWIHDSTPRASAEDAAFPTPIQQSKIESLSTSTGVAGKTAPVVISGSFTEKIASIQLNGEALNPDSWTQTPTSITVTLPAKAAGTYQIQIYNGAAPLLATQKFTFKAPEVAKPATVKKKKTIYIHCVKPKGSVRIVYGIDPQCPVGTVKQ